MEKCAVCAASPISTTGTERPSTSMRCVQRSHTTRGKRIQLAEPRRCVALLISEWPPRYLANSFSQKAMASGCSISVEAMGLPDGLGRLDDEGRCLVVELVDMRLEPAVLGLFEGEGEGVEGLVRAQPDEAAVGQIDVGLEDVGVALADAAVEAVAGDDQVGLVLRGNGLVVGGVGLEHQIDAKREAALLQDVQQLLAADAAEAVASRAHLAALEEHLDVVPVMELVADERRGVGVGRARGCPASGRSAPRPSRRCRRGGCASTTVICSAGLRAFINRAK